MTHFNHIHGIIMASAWFGLTNLAIWSLRFKYYSAAMFIHMVIGILLSLTVVMGGTIQLVQTDFNFDIFGDRYYHNGVGTILILFLPIFVLSGIICKFYKSHPDIGPGMVKWTTYCHKFLGWMYIVASRIPLYTGWQPFYEYPTILYIIGDFVSMSLFWFLKIREPKLTKIAHIEAAKDNQFVRNIYNMRDLDIYGSNFFIFANKVYHLYQLLGSHPGGYKVIDKVRGRQVDRFIIGQESLQEFSRSNPHAHSTQSIKLAGDIIAEIDIVPSYKQMNKTNAVSLSLIDKISEQADIYIIYLRNNQTPFKYVGYSGIEQLGRYYALTAEKKITRLYSQVNFVHKTNIELMNRIFKDMFSSKSLTLKNTEINRQDDLLEDLIEEPRYKFDDQELIPLLIKRYDKGIFTSTYINSMPVTRQFQLSEPLGFGIALPSFVHGKIVILAGGTGIYPFSDLIDLLFKSMLIQKNHRFTSQLTQNDPILKSKPFEGYQFQIYYSVRNIDEIHPLTANQMNQLSKKKKAKCSINPNQTIEKELKSFRKKHKYLELQAFKFQEIISSIVDEQYSGILICGPSRATRMLLKKLNELEINPNKYRII